ncbi:MAG: hypothetical protein A3I66_11435 [Burkholderiales bacterium RIFCSPLOWO2_02_FULL_57_36]|nr:MAG: hypothetical protein A3I66_11435 [Burkholderiales bacterium RIFCSPLOWO2_02_FULL_57_36]
MNHSRPIVQVARGTPTAGTLLAPPRSMPLPPAERVFFESMLKHDFSRVRVHTGEGAAAAASALQAKAFTEGSDIAFAAGRYRPDTPHGRQLLAHELVHVAQQSRGGASSGSETRAAQAAQRAAHGEAVSPQAQGGAEQGVQCDDDEKKKPDEVPVVSPQGGTVHLPTFGRKRKSPFGGESLTPPFGFESSTLLQPSQTVPPLDLQLFPPVKPPYHLMLNADILAPFSQYGTTPGVAGMDIRGDWASAYVMFRRYMPEGLAATSANTFLASAYKSSFAFNQPDIFDKSNLDFKTMYPKDKSTPIIPLLSSSSLTTIYEMITKKKNTNAFYF